MTVQRILAPVLLLALGAFGVWAQGEPGGRIPAFALACGVALGVAMQRSRFCFYCHLREWLDEGEPRGVLAILLAIAVGLVGYTVVLGSWLPEPRPGNLPPDIHIGPVSWPLVAAGLAFGAGMVISGSCISGHFYRLAEGSPTAPFALLGAGIGFVPGFMGWNTLYSLGVADAPIVWIPAYLGYGGALLFQLGLLALAAAWVWRGFAVRAAAPESENGASPPPSPGQAWRRLWEGRWPYWTGGLIVGLVGVFAIIRMKPLGVTAPIGSVARALARRENWIPEKLHGLDGFAGCASAPQDSWLTPENLLLAGLVGGAFVASLASAQFTLQKPQWRQAARGLGGGVLLGWGAMTGLGCTIGTLLSGAQAGAVSGWVFGMAMFAAIWGGLKIKRRLA
ncbi:MAG: YeeE/YedE family protein [Azoarcus sp.]|jgi:uncharacterized membrane protein YedE/YeeE|nr:YeeE/YedE family protein [Azoarcus sp.]